MEFETKPLKRRGAVWAILMVGLLFFAPPAEANIVRGVQKIVAGVFQIPISILGGTFSGPPIVGTLMGAINGTIQGVGLVASGALDLAASGVSVAKTVGPYLIPIFF